MPLWGSKDDAANSDIAAVIQYNRATTSANQTALFDNTTPGDFIPGQIVGQFGIDTNEAQATKAVTHSGWVLRKEGTGLRAGRVTYEVLVATGSIETDADDDTVSPDVSLVIYTQPKSNTRSVPKDLTFTVVANSTPVGASLNYQWQRYITGNTSWVDVVDAAGYYAGATNDTLTANNLNANGTSFRAVVSATGANSITSKTVTISLHP